MNSAGYLRVGADGLTHVEACLRLGGLPHIQCCTYAEEPPILSIKHGTVSVTITVPDSEHVTAEDVDAARLLANETARYLTTLAGFARQHQDRAAGAA